MDKPNIIFYFSDQQRADTLNERVTPFLTELARKGTRFDNAYTCQPVCGPARACLQTGEYAYRNGCYKNDIAMSPDALTIAKLLNAEGYDTAYIGKWHLASTGVQMNNKTKPTPEALRGGYRYWHAADCLEFTSNGYGGYVYDNDGNKVEFDYYRADAINDMAIEYVVKERDKTKPFFMFISQLEPHHQNSTDNYECPQGSSDQFKDMPIPSDLQGLSGNYNRCYHDYLACCNALDKNVHKLVEQLKIEGLWDNTILIYTSDHGCHFRTRNFEYKRSCHNSSTHVPLIISGGEFNKGVNYNGLVSLIDLPTTVLRAAGIKTPQNYDGIPIQDLIGGTKSRDNVYVEISESQLGRAIITDKYTYSVKKRRSFGVEAAGAKAYVDDKLYDNITDPNQRKNLIRDPKYTEIKNELRDKLLSEIEKHNAYRPKIKNKLTNFRSQP